jgi:seryl-tRNA synthetase
MFFKKNRSNDLGININKKVHLLTLDNRWHELFKENKSREIKKLENKLNDLIKEEGKLNTEYKEYSALKKKVMKDIVENMTEAFEEDDEAMQTMDKSKKYINDINKKLDDSEYRLTNLPKDIGEVNKKLLEVSMADCYNRMMKSKNEVTELEKEINTMRSKLKELIIKRDENNDLYEHIYTYMHDLVGPDVIEQFDKLYLGGK